MTRIGRLSTAYLCKGACTSGILASFHPSCGERPLEARMAAADAGHVLGLSGRD